MSKSANLASKDFFDQLDGWCEKNGEVPPNIGAKRYLASSTESRNFFAKSKSLKKCAVSTVYHFSLLEYLDVKFLLTHGLDIEHVPDYLFDTEFEGGEITHIVLEHHINPRVNVTSVVDFIGAGEIGVNNYKGHLVSDVKSIFGPIRKFELKKDFELSFEKICLDIALHSLHSKNIWMEEGLIQKLISLNQLDLNLPTYNLLRSVQDSDPAGLFLSLYRCIEATYAYKICTSLKSKLDLDIGWIEIYESLDNTASWRPRELDSLSSILNYGSSSDCADVLSAIRKDKNPKDNKDETTKHNKAAEAIYGLRNSLVHFKPYQSLEQTYATIDWTKLCSAMVGYIGDIYREIHHSFEYGEANI